MVNFSKYRHVAKIVNNEVPYELVKRIAEMRIIEKARPMDIARETGVKYNLVMRIIESKHQEGMWLDAISDLGRNGEMDEILLNVQKESEACPQCTLFGDICTHLE